MAAVRRVRTEAYFPHLHRAMPTYIGGLMDQILEWRREKKRWVTYAELEGWAAAHFSGISKQELRAAVHYLSDNHGEALYFERLQADRVYIDPLWLMDLMKCVVRHDLHDLLNDRDWFFEHVMPDGTGDDFHMMKRGVERGRLDRRVVAALWTHPPASNASTRVQERRRNHCFPAVP